MNVSICDTSLRPLHSDFEGSGTICALIRLYEEMAEHYEMPSIPEWVVEDRLTSVLGSEAETGTEGTSDMHFSALELISKLARLEETILADIELVAKQNHNKRTRVEYTLNNEEEPSSPRTTMSLMGLCRLLLGACCEAYAALACCRLYLPMEKGQRTKDARRARRLHMDSCMAATWTSAHAQYLSDLTQHGITATMPTVHSVPSELGELDLSSLYSMRTNIKSVSYRESQHLLNLMSRCTNPGSRGWDSVVKQSLEKSVGARRIAYNALLISVTGMHSCVYPAHRLHWKERAVLIASMPRALPLSSLTEVAMQCIVQFKECMRRMVSNCISGDYAMVAALAYVEHPVALLQPSPLVMPMARLKASAAGFVNAGCSFLRQDGRVSILDCIKASFSSQSAGYSGESCLERSTGKATTSIHCKVPAIKVAADVWAVAFRANFVPFWTHGTTHKMRALRLDPVQYKSIHSMNAATQLTQLLTDRERMAMNRLALKTPSAGVMTLGETASLMGVRGIRGSSCNGGSKGPLDAVRTFGASGEKNAALMLCFCRTAWISEEFILYDLGKRTARMQASALLRRLLVDEVVPEFNENQDPIELLMKVPEHSRNLCACIECKRVSNAYAQDGGFKWSQCFSEIGTSGSMISVDPSTKEVHMRCAKRSSASLRSAAAFEQEMGNMSVEDSEINAGAIDSMLVNSKSGSGSGASSRVRRDAKAAMEQRVSSMACGQEKMLSIPIVGKAIRIWGNWYSLCSLCGCMVRFYPSNRVGGEICCMRCDSRMLNRKEPMPQDIKNASNIDAPTCRYCGKTDPQRSGVKWKACRSPLDTTGRNSGLPPPLRIVHFCPQHFRPWIPAFIKTIPTRIVLSHIAYGAKPCAFMDADDSKADRGGARKRIRLSTKKTAT